jgi:hypothetical protein
MLAANAAPQMEAGESVRATVIGRVNSSPSGLDLSSLDLATNDIAGDELIDAEYGNPKDPNYAVLATDRNLYVFRIRPRSFTKLEQLVAKHPIGSVEVLLASLSGRLLIGSLAMGTGFQRARARRVIEAVGGSVLEDPDFDRRSGEIVAAEAG